MDKLYGWLLEKFFSSYHRVEYAVAVKVPREGFGDKVLELVVSSFANKMIKMRARFPRALGVKSVGDFIRYSVGCEVPTSPWRHIPISDNLLYDIMSDIYTWKGSHGIDIR